METIALNLNSLTDIVSNAVGMLVLFALITLFQVEQKVYEVEVPVEHETLLAPVFFICKDDAILKLDPRQIFGDALSGAAGRKKGAEFAIGDSGLWGKVDEESRFLLAANDTRGWAKLDDVRGTLEQMDPKREFAFFFVYDAATEFRVFRAARDILRPHGIKVGWRPVNEQHPPYLCFWEFVPDCNYSPAYR